MVSPIDEFGGFLKKMYGRGNATYQDEIRTNLLKLYSSSGGSFKPVAHAGMDNEIAILNPCLSIVGATTPNDFFANPIEDMVGQGAIPRFVLYIEDRELSKFSRPLKVDSTYIADEINSIINHRLREAVYSHGSTDSSCHLQSEYLLLNPAQNNRIEDWPVNQMDKDNKARAARIYRLIVKAGEAGIAKGSLNKVLIKSGVNSRMSSGILTSLVNSGKIEEVVSQGSGRSKTTYININV